MTQPNFGRVRLHAAFKNSRKFLAPQVWAKNWVSLLGPVLSPTLVPANSPLPCPHEITKSIKKKMKNANIFLIYVEIEYESCSVEFYLFYLISQIPVIQRNSGKILAKKSARFRVEI
jgi:hypothetical protein